VCVWLRKLRSIPGFACPHVRACSQSCAWVGVRHCQHAPGWLLTSNYTNVGLGLDDFLSPCLPVLDAPKDMLLPPRLHSSTVSKPRPAFRMFPTIRFGSFNASHLSMCPSFHQRSPMGEQRSRCSRARCRAWRKLRQPEPTSPLVPQRYMNRPPFGHSLKRSSEPMTRNSPSASVPTPYSSDRR
jgi:hypothetical protein